jgi:hypothetical protein
MSEFVNLKAEMLRIRAARIEELEAENERLRAENDKIRRIAAVWSDAHEKQSELALKYVFELNRVIAERNEVVAENGRLRAAADDLRQYVSRADYHHHVKDETKSALEEK